MWLNDSFSWLQAEFEQESRNVTTPDTLMDLVRNVFPPNLIQATMQQYRYAAVINDKKKRQKQQKSTKTIKTNKTTKTTKNDNKTTTENFLYNMHHILHETLLMTLPVNSSFVEQGIAPIFHAEASTVFSLAG